MNKLIIDNVDELGDLIITEDTTLLINLKDESGFVHIDVMDNVCLYILAFGYNTKNKIEYNLKGNSRVIINKISYDTNDDITINLNDKNAEVIYNSSIINNDNNSYYQKINHNASNTISKITNHAINLKDNSFTFDVDAKVFNDSNDCYTIQDNKIINIGGGKCEIKPNLLVDNNQIVANHSAYIGGFDPTVVFYLQTRGINEANIKELLTFGFLIGKMELTKEETEKIGAFIKKYI